MEVQKRNTCVVPSFDLTRGAQGNERVNVLDRWMARKFLHAIGSPPLRMTL
jgi:hypothetical protein